MESYNNRQAVLPIHEQQIALAIEAAHIGYWNYDPKTGVLTCNNKTKELFALPQDKELDLSHALVNVHPEDRPFVIKAIEGALSYENEGKYQAEYRINPPDCKDVCWVKAIGQSFKNDLGIVTRFSGILQDITADKQAESELIYQKALLEAQSNAIPDALLVVDTKGKMLSYNHRFAEIWQMPRHIIDAKDDDAALAHAMTLLKNPQAFIQRVLYLYKNNTQSSREEIELNDGRILERFGKAVIGENGYCYGWAWYFRDVTEEKRGQEKLKLSTERFRAAVKAVQGVLWTNNAIGEMEGEQPGWEALTGQTYKEYQGYGWSAALHPDDVPDSIARWQEAVEKKQIFSYEHRLKLADGSWGHFAVRAVPVTNDDGSIREWVGVHTNITSERKAQQALMESEDLFRSFSNKIKNLAWIANAEGWIYWYNQRWYDYTGTNFGEMQGWGWEKVHHPDHINRVVDFVKEAWGIPRAWELIFPLKSAAGEYRWFLTRAEPVLDNDGNIIRWIGTNTDIHEQIETADALKKSELSVKMLMEKKDEFMSIASHELKTPMTSLRAAIQLVERITQTTKDPVMLQSLAARANTQVEKLVKLIEDLLDVTKINAGKLVLNLSQFSPVDLINECIEQSKMAGSTHQVFLETECDISIYADRHRLEQVINNLISNAIKYSPKADRVNIHCSNENGFAKITVQDFGIGIPPEKLQFVFDRFFRLHDKSQQFAGIGLGLYISAEIVKRHGGEINATSSEGKGSTFWFTIPLVQTQ